MWYVDAEAIEEIAVGAGVLGTGGGGSLSAQDARKAARRARVSATWTRRVVGSTITP
jgi:DUF917 family protein